MSGEFRYLSSNFLWATLSDAADEPGKHEISKALAAFYAALAPVETACAWYEASDSGPSHPTITLQYEWARVQTAFDALQGIYRRDAELIRDLLRRRERLRQD